MILGSVLIKAYCICTFLTIYNEVWNIKNPRPYPKQTYYIMEWEKDDFYSQKIKGEWILRKYRKTDNETKRFVRNQYWERRNG